MSIFGIKRESK